MSEKAVNPVDVSDMLGMLSDELEKANLMCQETLSRFLDPLNAQMDVSILSRFAVVQGRSAYIRVSILLDSLISVKGIIDKFVAENPSCAFHS